MLQAAVVTSDSLPVIHSYTAVIQNTAVVSLASILSALTKIVYASNSLMKSLPVYILSGFYFPDQTFRIKPKVPPIFPPQNPDPHSLLRMRWVRQGSLQTVLTKRNHF